MVTTAESVRSEPAITHETVRRLNGTVVMTVLVVAVFGLLAYNQRWMSDDGMIVVREVRQIIAGNGPNYNPFQRDEVDTSPLWTFLLVPFALVFRADVAVDAVVVGLVCAVGGLAFGLAGSAALQRSRGVRTTLIPAGVLVPLAVAAFWDFATSGLETGLSMLWFGVTWWLITTITEHGSRRRALVTAVVVGLGPLVRPDFLLATVLFGAALLLIHRPSLRGGLGVVAVGALLPVGYEVFRAGYYGIAVPMPALAKEASSSLFSRGFDYLNDFIGSYQLWIPLALLCVVTTRMLARRAADRRIAILFAAPILSGLLLGAYVLRVGGDYMSGRMWVPVVFCLLLPVLLIPAGRGVRIESAGVALLMVWAIVAGFIARTPYQGYEFGPDGMINERSYEAKAYTEANPTSTASRLRDNDLRPQIAELTENGQRVLIISSGVTANGSLSTMDLSATVPDTNAFFYDNMGITAAVMPLDGTVVDVNGLASPLAGHLLLTQRGRAGHEKWLPVAWVIAEYAAPAAIAAMPDTALVTKAQVRAAAHALSCGRLKDLMDSVDAPMTIGRFFDNLAGSIGRTSLRVPADPLTAEQQFCG